MKDVTQSTTVTKLGKTYLRAGVAVGTALALSPAAHAVDGADPMQPIYDKLNSAASGVSGAQIALYGVLIMIIGGLLAWAYFKRTAK